METVAQRKDHLVSFFLVTLIVSWVCFTVIAVMTRQGAVQGNMLGTVRAVLLLVGVFAPALTALCLTMRYEGKGGLTALLCRILQWRVAGRWYVFAVGYIAAIKLLVALIFRILKGSWPRFGSEPWWLIAIAIVISTPVQAGEEIGWRGYALPRLAERFGFARASLVLGVFWACWHLPIFFIPGADKYGQSFPLYFLQVVALSVAATYLYVNTSGSLLLLMLMHSAVNQSVGIVPSVKPDAGNPFSFQGTLVGWLTVGLLWIAATCFLMKMSRAMSKLMELKASRHYS